MTDYKRGMTLQEVADAEYKDAPSQEPFAWVTVAEGVFLPKLKISERPAEGWKPVYLTPPDAAAQIAELQQKINTLTQQNARSFIEATNKITKLERTIAEWEQKAANWFASPEAEKRLDGYRELAQRINTLEQELDEWRHGERTYPPAKESYNDMLEYMNNRYSSTMVEKNEQIAKLEEDRNELRKAVAALVKQSTKGGGMVDRIITDKNGYKHITQEPMPSAIQGQEYREQIAKLEEDNAFLKDAVDAAIKDTQYFRTMQCTGDCNQGRNCNCAMP